MDKTAIAITLKLHPIHCAVMRLWSMAVSYGACNIALFGGHPDDFIQAHSEAMLMYAMNNVDMVIE
jgi:hypothetical protein